MKTNVELMSLYWTTAGVFPWNAEISRFDFKERVEAAARAGFKGIGIWHTDLEHDMLHRSLKEMKMILDDNGIQCFELEFLTDWFVEGGRRDESDGRKRRLLQAAEALHAKHIKVGDFYNTPYSMPRLVESFVALCKEAENAGAAIGFELMGGSMIDNLKDAITLVETAGAKQRRPHPGYRAGRESWHSFRGNPPHPLAVFAGGRAQRRRPARQPAVRLLACPPLLRRRRFRRQRPDPLRPVHGLRRPLGGGGHVGRAGRFTPRRTGHPRL